MAQICRFQLIRFEVQSVIWPVQVALMGINLNKNSFIATHSPSIRIEMTLIRDALKTEMKTVI